MLCTQFYCNTPTHQESVWIHISVVSRSHFVITPSQSKSICPPLAEVTSLSLQFIDLTRALLVTICWNACMPEGGGGGGQTFTKLVMKVYKVSKKRCGNSTGCRAS